MMHPNDHSSDAAFKLKEIACFMQHFRVQRHDDLAISIVEDLNSFLKLGGDCNQIFEYLAELEAYAEKTSSQDYVWELVYARRAIKFTFAEKENYEAACENALISAKHFDAICRLLPSAHNRCCRILENLTAIGYIQKTKPASPKTDQIRQIFDYCCRWFGEIEEEESGVYYLTACQLYLNLYIFGTQQGDSRDACHDWLLQYILFSMKRYEWEEDSDLLRMLLIAYAELSEFSKFSYEREKERICTVLAWAERAIEKGATNLQRSYDRLKEIVRKFENPSA